MTAESWRRSLRGLERWCLRLLLLGALGLLACRGYYYESRAYFANTTREPVKVRVQKLVAEVDCAKVEGRSAELLAHRALFGNTITYDVAAGEALPLDLDDDDFSGSQSQACAVLVQVLGFPDQVVFWAPGATSVQTETKMAEGNSSRFLAQSLALEGHGDVKGLAAGKGLEVTPLPPLASGMEAVSDPPAALGWSGTPRTGTGFVLESSETLPDGCLSLVLVKDPDPGWPLFLCAPAWSFPFELGDTLSVTFERLAPQSSSNGAPDGQPSAQHLAIWKHADAIRLDIWLNASKPQVAAVGDVTSQGAAGRRTACGAYVEPASVSVQLPEVTLVLVPGDEREH